MGDVVAAGLAAVLALAAASGTLPTSAPAAKPLREIGHVRALTPACKLAIQHADAVIGTALDNDVRIAFTISNLRVLDLDSTTIKKVDGTRQLQQAYTDLRAATARGEAGIAQLRSDASAKRDDRQRAELAHFADALGAVLSEQTKLADKLGSYVAYLDSHPPIDDNEKARMLFDLQLAQSQPHSPIRGDARDYLPPTLTELARTAADRMAEQQTVIASDEGAASERVEPAFKDCLPG